MGYIEPSYRLRRRISQEQRQLAARSDWTGSPPGSQAPYYKQTNAGGVESYTFRVRGVTDAGGGNWTESDPVQPPPLEYHGADVGVDYVTLKMTNGPWWYEFRKNGDWGSCTRVASGGITITGLRPGWTQAVVLYSSSGCSEDRIGGIKSFVNLSDIYDWEHCWNTDDCRNIDNPDNFQQHTHKRSRLHTASVDLSGCWSGRERHQHDWPSGSGGWHWHCPN